VLSHSLSFADISSGCRARRMCRRQGEAMMRTLVALQAGQGQDSLLGAAGRPQEAAFGQSSPYSSSSSSSRCAGRAWRSAADSVRSDRIPCLSSRLPDSLLHSHHCFHSTSHSTCSRHPCCAIHHHSHTRYLHYARFHCSSSCSRFSSSCPSTSIPGAR
jgi:hypothetical protein